MQMVMACLLQLQDGVWTVVQTLSQVMQHNGLTSMRMVLVTISQTEHGLTGLKTGLVNSFQVHLIKTLVQCNQVQAGKMEFLAVLILTEMDGGMCKMHSLVSLRNGSMQMEMAMVTINPVSILMVASTLQEIQPLIVSAVPILTEMVALTLNSHGLLSMEQMSLDLNPLNGLIVMMMDMVMN